MAYNRIHPLPNGWRQTAIQCQAMHGAQGHFVDLDVFIPRPVEPSPAPPPVDKVSQKIQAMIESGKIRRAST